jgi:hypothetical protein
MEKASSGGFAGAGFLVRAQLSMEWGSRSSCSCAFFSSISSGSVKIVSQIHFIRQ